MVICVTGRLNFLELGEARLFLEGAGVALDAAEAAMVEQTVEHRCFHYHTLAAHTIQRAFQMPTVSGLRSWLGSKRTVRYCWPV